MKEKSYKVNEIFYSIAGEGVRAGTVNVFVRFAGCNLKCDADDPFSGFVCDTEFSSGSKMTAHEILLVVIRADVHQSKSIIFTGGEPALQIDTELIELFRYHKFFLAIETNGTKQLPITDKYHKAFDWITVSPKSAEHTLKLLFCDELKYVRHTGQAIPKPLIQAAHYLISPAVEADGTIAKANLDHCIKLCLENPKWRLSLQLHKLLGVR